MKLLKLILGLSLAAAIAPPSFGQALPNAVPMPTPEIQYLNSAGQPLIGAFLCSFAAGTSTPLATYTDSTAGTPNTNPIVLDSAGRASVWVGPQLYKFVLYVGGTRACPSTGAVQWSQDNVSDTTLYFTNFVKTVGTSTLITYTAPGTGAVSRTVASKLAETISILDFGAVCDWNWGMNTGTDNTTAIQNTINAVAAAGGGRAYVPAGACAFSGRINVPNTVKIQGTTAGQFSGSQLVYTGNPTMPTAALVFNAPIPGNYTSGMANIDLAARYSSNVNSIGIWLGGDLASVQSPNAYYGAALRFEDNYVQNFGVGAQYGTNAFLNEWRGNIFWANQIQFYIPIGQANTGDVEKMYGGLFTGGIKGGVKIANSFFEFYGVGFEFNSNFQLSVDNGLIQCFACNMEQNSEVAGDGTGGGFPITTWNTKNPWIQLRGGFLYYDCSSGPLPTEFVNFDGANSVNFSAEDMAMGSFFGCIPPTFVSAVGVADPVDSNIYIRRISASTTLTLQPIKTNITNTFYMSLTGSASCYGCDGSALSGPVNYGRQALQFNSYPLTFAPLPISGGTNTSAPDAAINHWINNGALMVYKGPPNPSGPDQDLVPLYAGNWVNSFSVPTATPGLDTALQGELYQRSQASFGTGRQRVCAGDPSSPYRTCMDLEANSGIAAHNNFLWYVQNTQMGSLNQNEWYSNIGWSSPIRTITATTSYLTTDDTILCNAAGGGVTATLPAAGVTTKGKIFHFKKIDSTMNICAAASAGGNVDNQPYLSLTTQYASLTLQNDGTSWWVIGH